MRRRRFPSPKKSNEGETNMKIAMCQMCVVYGDADGNLARAQAYI